MRDERGRSLPPRRSTLGPIPGCRAVGGAKRSEPTRDGPRAGTWGHLQGSLSGWGRGIRTWGAAIAAGEGRDGEGWPGVRSPDATSLSDFYNNRYRWESGPSARTWYPGVASRLQATRPHGGPLHGSAYPLARYPGSGVPRLLPSPGLPDLPSPPRRLDRLPGTTHHQRGLARHPAGRQAAP